MSDSQAYDLYSTGKVVDGFDQDQVAQSFSGLFNCAQEKALAYATTKKIIRKEIDKATGESYSETLRSIGLDVQLIPRTPPAEEPAAANGGLSLTPIETETDEQDDESAGMGLTNTPAQPAAAANPGNTVAAAGAAVTGAAVVGPAAIAQANTGAAAQVKKADYERDKQERDAMRQAAIDEFNHVEPFAKAIMGPIAGAIIGAIIWAIVIKLGYEFGLIALAVGGLIGKAANYTGFIGYTRGVICALLCAAAIFGGKYIGYTLVYDEIMDGASGYVNEAGETEAWDAMYKREAAELADMNQTDANLKKFMLANEYAFSDEPITAYDLEYFRESQIPYINEMAGLSAEEVTSEMGFDEEELNLSVWSLVMGGLGGLDLLFLFLGMGTAFRLATEDE